MNYKQLAELAGNQDFKKVVGIAIIKEAQLISVEEDSARRRLAVAVLRNPENHIKSFSRHLAAVGDFPIEVDSNGQLSLNGVTMDELDVLVQAKVSEIWDARI